MINFCKQAGAPSPKFEDGCGFFSVTLRFKEPIRYVQFAGKSQQDLSVVLTDRQKEILGILKSESLGRKQIMSKMKNPPSDRMVQIDLLSLRKYGLVGSKGKVKATIWFIAGK